jgi:hypothetical protein
MPSPDDLYQLRSLESAPSRVTLIANPNAPLPKTVSYELGYEHAFFEQFRVKVAGYYKDVSLEPLLVDYIARSGNVRYSRSEPNSYLDIRGFEFDFRRERGKWLRGFFNYTYMVRTSGRFGLPTYYENPTQQREEVENNDALRRAAQSRPIPSPFARLNLDFITPDDFGPSWLGVRPLSDLRISALGSWREGGYLTWVGGGRIEGIENNLQFADFTNLNLRLSKDFRMGGRSVELYVDVFNALNQRRLSFNGFVDGNDYNAYMESLHLPESDVYRTVNTPGDDKPGDFRHPDVAFVPITNIGARTDVASPVEGRFYYERESGTFIQYRDGAFGAPDQAELDRVLDEKAYIDMPNQGFLTFLDPRDIYFGVRFSF